MSLNSLKKIFERELAFCLKTMKALSQEEFAHLSSQHHSTSHTKLSADRLLITASAKERWEFPNGISIMASSAGNGQSWKQNPESDSIGSKSSLSPLIPSTWNARRRLSIQQFRSCWEKFGPHLPPKLVASRLVETGETLIEILGFHDIADSICFAPFLERSLGSAGSRAGGGNAGIAAEEEPEDEEETDEIDGATEYNAAKQFNSEPFEIPEKSILHHLPNPLRIRMVDPTLRSPEAKTSMLVVLDGLVEVIGKCMDAMEEEDFDGQRGKKSKKGKAGEKLVIRGMTYVVAIVETLVRDGNEWKEPFDILSFLQIKHGSLQSNSPTKISESIPSKLGYFGDAFILQCAQTVDKMYNVEIQLGTIVPRPPSAPADRTGSAGAHAKKTPPQSAGKNDTVNQLKSTPSTAPSKATNQVLQPNRPVSETKVPGPDNTEKDEVETTFEEALRRMNHLLFAPKAGGENASEDRGTRPSTISGTSSSQGYQNIQQLGSLQAAHSDAAINASVDSNATGALATGLAGSSGTSLSAAPLQNASKSSTSIGQQTTSTSANSVGASSPPQTSTITDQKVGGLELPPPASNTTRLSTVAGPAGPVRNSIAGDLHGQPIQHSRALGNAGGRHVLNNSQNAGYGSGITAGVTLANEQVMLSMPKSAILSSMKKPVLSDAATAETQPPGELIIISKPINEFGVEEGTEAGHGSDEEQEDNDEEEDDVPPPLFAIIRRRASSITACLPRRRSSFNPSMGGSSYSNRASIVEPPNSIFTISEATNGSNSSSIAIAAAQGEGQTSALEKRGSVVKSSYQGPLRRGSDASKSLRRLSLISSNTRRLSRYQDRLAIGLNELTEQAENQTEEQEVKPPEKGQKKVEAFVSSNVMVESKEVNDTKADPENSFGEQSIDETSGASKKDGYRSFSLAITEAKKHKREPSLQNKDQGRILSTTVPVKEKKAASTIGAVAQGVSGKEAGSTKAVITAMENEEHRNRRFLIYDIYRMLRSFRGDAEKMHALVSGIDALMSRTGLDSHSVSSKGSAGIAATAAQNMPMSSFASFFFHAETDLQFERPAEDQIQHDRRILVVFTILDIAFELLSSAPDTLHAKNSPLYQLIVDIEMGRPMQTVIHLVNPYQGASGNHASTHSHGNHAGKPGGILHNHAPSSASHSNHPVRTGPMGRMPTLAETSVLMSESRTQRFNREDLIGLARKLFRCHQWERFTLLAQLMEPLGSKDAKQELSPEVILSHQKEMALRIAVINFHNVTHAERRVLFDNDVVETLKGTVTDLNAKRLEVPDGICDAALSLLTAISECIEDPILPDSHPRLFVDAAHLLWRFAEPFVRDVTSPDDAGLMRSLTPESIIVVALRSVHIILSEFPNIDTLFAVKASSKLALVLECIGCFGDAASVLRETVERISIAREAMGESSFGVRSITCHVGLHPTFDTSRHTWIEDDANLLSAPRQISSDLQSRNPVFGTHDPTGSLGSGGLLGGSVCNKSLGPWSLADTLRMELPCEETLVLASLFRCEIKAMYAEQLVQRRQKEEEHYRLTRKKLQQNPLVVDFSENDIVDRCGDNAVWRAILLSALAAIGPNLTVMKRHKLLKDACAMLKKEHRVERHLLDVVSGNKVPYTNTPMTCPPPSFVRRTPTSITIRPNHISVAGPNSPKLVPELYEAFCKRSGKSKVAFSDVGYVGTGIPVPVSKRNEITISGLSPNRKYIFAVAGYQEDGSVLGRGIGETSEGIVSMLPLPLILCWGHFAEIADALDCDDIADEAYSILRDHFVEWTINDDQLSKPPTSGHTGVNHEPVFRLRERSIHNCSPTILRFFMRSIFAHVDRRFEEAEPEVRSDARGSRNVLEAQMTRLRAARDMMIAMDIASKIGDGTGVLSSAFRIANYMIPLFQHGLEVPFAVHALLLSHSSIVANVDELENDRASAVRDIFVPITALLCRRLIAWYEYSSAIRLAEESLSLINIVIGAADLRILNSSYLEFQWTGYVQKTKNTKAPQKKGQHHHEFVFHSSIAQSRSTDQGYTDIRKRMDVFCEYLESVIAQCNSIIKNPTTERKMIDTHTSLREIYSVLATLGPDVVVSEMLRFRKNPRYLEIMVHCADWCLSSRLTESASRICMDTIDWIGLRNRFLTNVNAVWSEAVARKEIVQKRRRRNLFAERKAPVETVEQQYAVERKSRARDRRAKTDDDEDFEALKHSLVDGAGRPRSRSRKLKKLKDAAREQEEAPSSPPQKKSAANSRAQSPSQAKPNKSRPTSRERSKVSKSRSRSASPNESESATSFAANIFAAPGAKVIGKKRRRMAQKNILLGHLSQTERDGIEKASKILDADLGSMWKQKRHLRRLRVITAYEAQWRSQLALMQGQAMLSLFEKELFAKGAVAGAQNHNFAALPCKLLFTLPKGGEPKEKQSFSAEWIRSVSEILQSFVQAVNIAARFGIWSQVLDGCQQLWSTVQYLSRYGLLQNEFWQSSLWRAFFLTGDKLMDMIENIRITLEDPSTNRLAHGVSFSEKRFDISDFRRDKPVIPGKIAMDAMELQDSRFFGFWNDLHGSNQFADLDMAWVGEYVIFSLDLMKSAGKLHRLKQTLKRFDDLFGETFHESLVPFSEFLKQKDSENVGPNLKEAIHLSLHLLPGAPPPEYPELECQKSPEIMYIAERKDHISAYGLLHEARKYYQTCLGNHFKLEKQTVGSLQDFLDAFEAYEDVFNYFQTHAGEKFILAAAYHEYADLLFMQGEKKAANAYWSKTIDTLTGITRTISTWKNLSAKLWDMLGDVKRVVLAGMSAAKMAMIGYPNDLEKRTEVVSFASFLLSSPLCKSIPHPSDPLTYANYIPVYVLPDFNFAKDPLTCNPTQLAGLLLFLCRSLLFDRRPIEALPLAGFASYIAAEVLEDETLLATTNLLKAEILSSLGLINMALERLFAVLTGGSLLPRFSTLYQHALSISELRFEESESIYDSSNWEILRGLAAINFGDRLTTVLSRHFSWSFDICRATIILSLLKRANIEDPLSYQQTLTTALLNAANSSLASAQCYPGCHANSVSSVYLADQAEYDIIYPTRKLLSHEKTFAIKKPILPSSASVNFGSTAESPQTAKKAKKCADRDDAYALLQRLENLMLNVSIQIEAERKEGTSDSSLDSFVFMISNVCADVSKLRCQLDVAAHRYLTIQKSLELKPHSDLNKIFGPTVKLVTSNHLIKVLLSMGKFELVEVLSMDAKTDATAHKSLSHQLKFCSLELLARLRLLAQPTLTHRPGTVKNFSEAGERRSAFENCLSQFYSFLGEAKKRSVDKLVVSEGWEILGDVLREIKADHLEAISLAYDMAYEAATSYVPYDPCVAKDAKRKQIKFQSSYSKSLSDTARIQLKRSWSAQSLADVSLSASLLEDSLKLAKLSVPIFPKRLIPSLVLSQGKISFYLRLGTKNSSDAFRTLTDIGASSFLELASSCISTGTVVSGWQFEILKNALQGIISLMLDGDFSDEVHKFSLEVIKIAKANLKAMVGLPLSEKEFKAATEGKEGQRQMFDPIDANSAFVRDAVYWKSQIQSSALPFMTVESVDFTKIAPTPTLPLSPIQITELIQEDVRRESVSSASSTSRESLPEKTVIKVERWIQGVSLTQKEALEFYFHLISLQTTDALPNDPYHNLLGARHRLAHSAILPALTGGFSAMAELDLGALKEFVRTKPGSRAGSVINTTVGPATPNILSRNVSSPMQRKDGKKGGPTSCIVWLPFPIRTVSSPSSINLHEGLAWTMLICFGPTARKKKATPSQQAAKIEKKATPEPSQPAESHQPEKQATKKTKSEKTERASSARSRPSTAKKSAASTPPPQQQPNQYSPPASPSPRTSLSKPQQEEQNVEFPHNRFVARVSQDAIEQIQKLCGDTIVLLRKFAITGDEMFKQKGKEGWKELGDLICSVFVQEATVESLKIDTLDLEVEVLHSIQKMFQVETGHSAETPQDEVVFAWLFSMAAVGGSPVVSFSNTPAF
ncbi:hypothetical protein HDU97_009277 [Phlyctochytrium planicorne]|nr:hypothetical protein HDU97_009277 [Phlyctochytrium planicorne]